MPVSDLRGSLTAKWSSFRGASPDPDGKPVWSMTDEERVWRARELFEGRPEEQGRVVARLAAAKEQGLDALRAESRRIWSDEWGTVSPRTRLRLMVSAIGNLSYGRKAGVVALLPMFTVVAFLFFVGTLNQHGLSGGWWLVLLAPAAALLALFYPPDDLLQRTVLAPARWIVALVAFAAVFLNYMAGAFSDGLAGAAIVATASVFSVVAWPLTSGPLGVVVAVIITGALLALEPALRPVVGEVFTVMFWRRTQGRSATSAGQATVVVQSFRDNAERLRVRLEAYWVVAAIIVIVCKVVFSTGLLLAGGSFEVGNQTSLVLFIGMGVVIMLGVMALVATLPLVNAVTSIIPETRGPFRSEWVAKGDGTGWHQVVKGSTPVASKVDSPPPPKDEHGSAEWLKPGDLKDMGFTE